MKHARSENSLLAVAIETEEKKEKTPDEISPKLQHVSQNYFCKFNFSTILFQKIFKKNRIKIEH